MSLQRPSIRYGTQMVFGIVLLLLLAVPILASPLQQNCATMTFSPKTVRDVEVGDIVTLQVLLDADGVIFDVVGFKINFDPTRLQVVDALPAADIQIEPGPLLPGITDVNTASNTGGTIDFAQRITTPGGQDGGTFTVATIRFRVVGVLPAGRTQVTFVNGHGNTGVFYTPPPPPPSQPTQELLCEFPGPATIRGVRPGPVGGIVVPVNKLELLALQLRPSALLTTGSGRALWPGLVGLASLAALTVALVRKRRSA